MSNPTEPTAKLGRIQLEEKLREVDERLHSEMLARGFDPDQEDNTALTAPLAKLYLERENLRAQLEELAETEEFR
jgi:hypothetical protein